MSSFRSVLVLLVLAGCHDATGFGERRILWFHSDRLGAIGEPLVDSTLAVFTSFDDMRVIGLDAQNGRLRWQTRLPLPPGVPYAGMPNDGILSAYQDLVIVPAWDVYALDRVSGAVRWSFTEPDDYPGYNATVVAGGTVYSLGRDLYALDAATGALRFRKSIGEQPFRPVVVDSVIYVATRREVFPGTLGNGHVMALSGNTGATIWSAPIEDPQDSGRGGSVGPVFVTDSMVIVAGQNAVVYALDRSTGQTRWTYTGVGSYYDTAPSYSAGLAIVDRTVIVAGDVGSVEGVDLATGHRLWQTGPGSSVTERITLGDNVALVSVGALFAFDANGQIRWQQGGAGFGGPVFSTAATYKNGLVYIGSVSPEAPGPGFYALREP